MPEKQSLSLGISSSNPNDLLTIKVIENAGGHDLYLEDKFLQTLTKISETNYSFDYIPDQPNRFMLHFNPLEIEENAGLAAVKIFVSDNILYFKGHENGEAYSLLICDVTGRQLCKQKLNIGEDRININLKNGIYIVNLSNGKEQTTQKVYLE